MDDAVKMSSSATSVKIKARTLNLDANQYRDLWIPRDKIFWWKEFVMELQARAFVKVVLFWEDLINRELDLISLLARAAWLDRNAFNLSRDFVPPFANQNQIRLIDQTYPIPVVDFWAADITMDLSIKAYIDWILKAKCYENRIESNDCWNITFDTTQYKDIDIEAVYYNHNSDSRNSVIWSYQSFWFELKDFQYIPTFNVHLWVWASLHVHIPARWTETWSWWPYDIYTFRIETWEWLWTHRWTSWRFVLDDIKIYNTTRWPWMTQARQELNEDLEIYLTQRAEREREAELNRQRQNLISDRVSNLQDGNNFDDVQMNSWAMNQGFNNVDLSNNWEVWYESIINQQNKTKNMINILTGNSNKWKIKDLLINKEVLATDEDLVSKDDYVKWKLFEINKSFEDIYNEHLSNIDDTITQFNIQKNSISDNKEKENYDYAIDKLSQLKNYFKNRYWIFKTFKDLDK